MLIAFMPPNGTTSACAENTFPDRGLAGIHGNYLRVRGEYRLMPDGFSKVQELPPRARRIPHSQWGDVSKLGTTSACAEKTQSVTRSCWNAWNYLRVRGEYGFGGVFLTERMELPPRARRIHAEMKRQQRLWGTTSACAENTSKALASDMISRNYLRVRGEYTTL